MRWAAPGPTTLRSSKIKSNIIAIAKRKGWTKYLPKAWQDGDERKKPRAGNTTGLRLVESAGCAFLGNVPIREAARTSYPIKIISPGTGSSAHYPEAGSEGRGAEGRLQKRHVHVLESPDQRTGSRRGRKAI